MRVSLAALLTVAVVMWHPPLLDGRAEQTRAGLVEIAFVANAEAGTVALLDVASRSVLGSIDVNAARDTAGGPGSPNYAQDTDISPDGQSLFVSAMLVNRVYRISTATSEITGHVVTGVYPHDTKVSKDGERIYDTSLGPMASFPRPADAPPLTETPGYPFQLTIADAGTLEVRDRIRLDSAIRPWQFTPDEQGLYAQLSNEHAVVAYDLGARRVSGASTCR